MPNQPMSPTKNVEGDFDRFTHFTRRLVAVPHSEIKEQLEAETEATRTSSASAARISRPTL